LKIGIDDEYKTFAFTKDATVYDRGQYTYDVKVQSRDGWSDEARERTNRFVNDNTMLQRYSRLKPDRILPRMDDYAMICPPDSGLGYLTFREPEYWNFIQYLHTTLKKELNTEDKPSADALTINYCMMYPYAVMMHVNDDFKVTQKFYNLQAMRACSRVFATYERLSYENSDVNRIGMPAKKKYVDWTTV